MFLQKHRTFLFWKAWGFLAFTLFRRRCTSLAFCCTFPQSTHEHPTQKRPARVPIQVAFQWRGLLSLSRIASVVHSGHILQPNTRLQTVGNLAKQVETPVGASGVRLLSRIYYGACQHMCQYRVYDSIPVTKRLTGTHQFPTQANTSKMVPMLASVCQHQDIPPAKQMQYSLRQREFRQRQFSVSDAEWLSSMLPSNVPCMAPSGGSNHVQALNGTS